MPFLSPRAVVRCLLAWSVFQVQPGCSSRVEDDATGPQSEISLLSGTRGQPGEGHDGNREHDEAWAILYVHDQPVGWQVVRLYETGQEGKRCQAGEARSHLTVNRFGQTMSQAASFRCLQTRDGQVLETLETSESGTACSSTTGRRNENGLLLRTEQAGVFSDAQITLPAPCGGYFAVEWSLRDQPLRAGERRELRALVPLLHQTAMITLTGQEWCEASGDALPKRLLRIEQDLHLDGSPTMHSELLADEKGTIWESTLHGLGQRTRRTSRAEALAVHGNSYLDLGLASSIPVTTQIESPETITRIRYRIQLAGRDPSGFFAATDRQRMRSDGPDTVEIEVLHGEQAIPPTAADPPTPEDSASSALVQSDAVELQQMAIEATSAEGSLLERARSIERYVYRFVDSKDYSSALASALEVARTRRGDCTEHAVLTAALCRAARIPARGVIGLLHVPSRNAFVFHMWNEAWVGTHWHPLDSTLPRGHIGAVRLALTRSPLANTDSLAAFAPVLSVLGQLRVEVLEIARDSTPGPSSRNDAARDDASP